MTKNPSLCDKKFYDILYDQDYDQCKRWHKIHMQPEGWGLSSCKGCICEFVKISNPLGVDYVRISKNVNNTFEFVHSKRYYCGSMPRYLEKKERVCNEKGGFTMLQDLLNHLASN